MGARSHNSAAPQHPEREKTEVLKKIRKGIAKGESPFQKKR
jgi:hypothetical protein